MSDKEKKKRKPAQEQEPVENTEVTVPEQDAGEDDSVPTAAGISSKDANSFLRKMMDVNFLEYASYVIKERAIPDVDDGMKPVQRRILWSLYEMDDGKFHKVANVIGHTMKYHPHGDASIGDALVVVANKEYFIDKQGNFGNIFTGDEASAARYIECRLTNLAREVLFNNSITEFTDSYDGRNKEPIVLPSKIPTLLMGGADGIAVGMSTKILPHNFNELLQAQIAILKGEQFRVYPDFLQGGLMDVSKYEDGNGKITLRAKIDIEGRRLLIREVPATTTTENLIKSIEEAANKSKIKIASISDFTTDKVEIEILPMKGYDPEKAMKALYAYTDCSVNVTLNMMVICDGKPVQMTVSEILRRNTDKLLEYLKRELELKLADLDNKFHEKTLAQIFIENRIYKRIEKCKVYDLVLSEVRKGLEEFRHMLRRDIVDEDIERLLNLQIRRISLFDINKNRQEIDDILKMMDEVQKNLKHLKKFAIKYLSALLDKYGEQFQRRTVIETFEKIDMSAVALNNIKVGWDKKNCYIGRSVKSDDYVTCNEYDHLLCVERKGDYKIINIPDKIFIDRLYEFRKYDKSTEFGIVYSETKTGKLFFKRCVIDKFICDKEYRICPEGCRLELITPRAQSIYECAVESGRKNPKVFELNMSLAPLRSPKARGQMISSKKLVKLTFLRYLSEEGEEGAAAPVGDDVNNPGTSADIDNDYDFSDISEEDNEQPSLGIPGIEGEEEGVEGEAGRKKRRARLAKPASSDDSDDNIGGEQLELGF